MRTNLNKATSSAAGMLSRRPLSEKMLREKLHKKEYLEDEIDFAVKRMKELKAIDDIEYAKMLISQWQNRGYGKSRIKMNLKNKGISREIIDFQTQDLSANIENLVLFFEKKLKGDISDRKTNDKVCMSLVRKGFSFDDINKALKQYKEENCDKY